MDPTALLSAWPSGGAGIATGAALALAVALARLGLARSRAGANLITALHATEAGFLAALLAAMLIFSFLQIVLRNVVQTGWVWVDPLLRHLLLWIGFAGALLATRMDQHINVDALSRSLSPGGRRIARIATGIAAAAVCLVLSEAARAFLVDEAKAGTSGFLDIPTWCLLVVMPLALWAMAVRFVRHTIDAARGAAPPAPPAHNRAPLAATPADGAA
jgi:TRAP-type C4-dicarboxylate transport system permease small subunit